MMLPRTFFRLQIQQIGIGIFFFVSCSTQDSNAGRNAPGTASGLSSISIPIPSTISPYVGPDKINAMHLKIVPSNCVSGVTGTQLDRLTDLPDSNSNSLANEKIKSGCDYQITLSLGQKSSTSSLSKIYITNDMEGYRSKISQEQSKQPKIQLTVKLYATKDGKSDLNLPWDPISNPNNQNQNPGPGTGEMNWNVVLMASDQGNQGSWISAFDNARETIRDLLTASRVPLDNIRQMSLHPDQQTEKVKAASTNNFLSTVKALGSTGPNDACLIHMTSHGSPDGFNIGYDRLSPSALDAALTAGCGNRPTVVLVSACYSGLYVLEKSGVTKPNRIILTAARSDRTSFGCGTENQYTYWDSCLIENLPKSTKFKELASNIVSCIIAKEGGSTSSYPQTFIGSEVADLDLPGVKK